MTDEFTKELNLTHVKTHGYTTHTGSIACPHCGDEREYIYDDQENAPYENVGTQCGECEEYFYLSCEVETVFEFSSSKEEFK